MYKRSAGLIVYWSIIYDESTVTRPLQRAENRKREERKTVTGHFGKHVAVLWTCDPKLFFAWSDPEYRNFPDPVPVIFENTLKILGNFGRNRDQIRRPLYSMYEYLIPA